MENKSDERLKIERRWAGKTNLDRWYAMASFSENQREIQYLLAEIDSLTKKLEEAGELAGKWEETAAVAARKWADSRAREKKLYDALRRYHGVIGQSREHEPGCGCSYHEAGAALEESRKARAIEQPPLPSVQPGEADELRTDAADWQKQLNMLWLRIEELGYKVFYDEHGMPAIERPEDKP